MIILDQSSTTEENIELQLLLINQLLKKLDIKPKNLNNYLSAFISRNYLTECSLQEKEFLNFESYENLEFLGDSLIGGYVSEYLFDKYRGEDEGFFTVIKQNLTNNKLFSEVAQELGLTRVLHLSYLDAGKLKNIDSFVKLNWDLYESFVACIYKDLWRRKMNSFINKTLIKKHLKSAIELCNLKIKKRKNNFNYENLQENLKLNFSKSKLKELLDPLKLQYSFVLDQSKTPHISKLFIQDILIEEKEVKTNKKIAEQELAKFVLENFNKYKQKIITTC